MGLDMYLTGVIYCSKYTNNDTHKKLREILNIKEEQSIEMEIQEIYWRKANAIHKWFVENVQDGEDNCLKHTLEINDLVELKNTCLKVLNNKSKCDELLPTESGFFFGGTDYDEWYFAELKKTVKELERLIDENKYDYYIYQSSW